MAALDWETADNVESMLDAIRERANDRKLFLFACGCCRLAEGQIPGVGGLANILEHYAGANLGRTERWSIITLLTSAMKGDFFPGIARVLSGLDGSPWQLARTVAAMTRRTTTPPESLDHPEEVIEGLHRLTSTSADQAKILRELVANPQQQFAFSPAWRTETAVGIARAIEEESAWDRMPILADAIQDAGCEVAAILDHCRDTSIAHRRGCWVLDAILERD